MTSSHTTHALQLPGNFAISLASGFCIYNYFCLECSCMPCLHSWMPHLLLLVTQTSPCHPGLSLTLSAGPFSRFHSAPLALEDMERTAHSSYMCLVLVCRTKCHRGKGFSSCVHVVSVSLKLCVHHAGQINEGKYTCDRHVCIT